MIGSIEDYLRMHKEKVQLVWFKRDLRVEDHVPLVEACRRGKVFCCYIFEPSLLNSVEWSPAHRTFLTESLIQLNEALNRCGVKLHLFEGEVVEVFNKIRQSVNIEQIWSHQETGNQLTYERDKKVSRWCRDFSIPWNEYPQFGVIRRLSSREGWARQWNDFMSRPLYPKPEQPQSLQEGLECERPDLLVPPKIDSLRQRGGFKNGLMVLESFLQQRGRFYSKEMSSPRTAWESCSRLSPYFSFGNLSIRQVWHATELVRAEGLTESGWRASLSAFSSRLRWHCHFIQKLEDEPAIEFENMNRKMDGLRENEFNEKYFEAWKRGETGYPLVDACMRALHQTSWINFRMRAMLVSFSSYHLWLHWKKPADFLARYFLDFEPGIHFSQVQMQSGTTGINAIRIYSPIKQVLDHDPQGEFIKKWIPELEPVPTEFIAEPHKMPMALQKKLGIRIGTHYPAPIVEHSTVYSEAKKRIYAWKAKQEVREASKQVFLKHGSRRRPR